MDYPNRVIKLGEQDRTIMGALRQRFRELGFDVAAAPKPFDALFRSNVKLYQSRNVDELGRNLCADGKIGPLTWNALFELSSVSVGLTRKSDATPRELGERAIEIARQQIGTMEKPRNSNSGPQVENYLRAVGLPAGHAWCAAFVYWCFREADNGSGQVLQCKKSGGVLAQWAHAVDRKFTRVSAAKANDDPSLVVPGMVFYMDHGSGRGHTGFIARVRGAFFDTIEGNTDASKTREGGGVYALTRKVGEINKGFVLYR